MMAIPTATMAEQAPTMLIVDENEVQTVTSEPGLEANIRVFADTDANKALQSISRDPKAIENFLIRQLQDEGPKRE